MPATTPSEAALLDEVRQLRARVASLELERQIPKEIIEKAPVMISIVRAPDFVYELVNPAFQALAPGKEFLGRRFADVWAEVPDPLVEILRNVIATGETFHLEDAPYTIQRGPDMSPEVVYVSYSWVPLFGPDGRPDRVLTLAHEVTEAVRQRQQLTDSITELRRAEKENHNLLATVHEERDRLSAVITSINDEVWFADAQKRLVLVNPAVAREFHLDASDQSDVAQVAARFEVLRPDGSPRPVEEAPPIRALNGEVVTRQEEIVRTPGTGQLRHREVSSAPVKDASGKTLGSVSVVRDITERKRAEQALRESEESFRVLIQNVQSGVALIDETGAFTIVNSSFLRTFDIPQDTDILNVNSRDWSEWQVFSEDGLLLDVDEHPVRRAALSCTPVKNQLIAVKSPSSPNVKWLLVTAEPILDAQGKLHRLICTYYDITERKRAEEGVRRLAQFPEENPNPVLRISQGGMLLYANASATTWLVATGGGKDQPLPADVQALVERACREQCQVDAELDGAGRTFWFAAIQPPGESYVNLYGREVTERKRAEETLRLTQASVDGAAEMVAWFTPDGRVHYVNDATCRTLGYSREELLRMTALDFTPGFTWEQHREHWEEVRKRKSFTLEVTHRRKDGTEYPAEVLVNYFVYGGQEYIFAYGRDITERKRAEEALRESEERLRVAQELSPDGFTILQPVRDAQGRVIDFTWVYENAAVARMNGTDPNEIIGRRLLEVFPGHRDTEFFRSYRHVAETGETRVFEAASQGDTTPKRTWFRIVVVRLGSDIAVLAQDLTERKQAEELLAGAMQRLSAHMENSPLAIVEFDPQFRVTRWSAEAEKLFGWTADEILGRAIVEMRWVYEDDIEAVRQVSQDMFTGKHPRNLGVNRNYRKDGTVVECEWYNSAIYDTDGRLSSILSQVRDISERKRAEQALRDSEKALRTFFESPGVMRGIVELVDGAIIHVSCNAAAAEMYGIDANSIRGKTAAEMGASEEIVKAWIELYEESRRTGRYVSGEYARRDANGNERWLLATAAFLGDGPNGNPQFAYSIIDLTGRKRAEEALRQSLERLERVLEVQTVGVMFWDLNTGCMVDANDTFLRLMGYSRSEVEARELTWQKLTPPEYMDVSRAEVEKFLATGRVGPYEKEYFRKDGTRRWLLFAGSSLGNNQCVEFCVDISDRKRAEEALRESEARERARAAELRESEERLRVLGDNLPDSAVYQYVHELDGSVRFVYCSAGIERINCVKASEVLRDPWVLHGQIPPEYMVRLVEEELRSKRNLSDFEMELPMRRPDGEVRWMRLQSRPRRLPDGRTVWDGVQTDTTEQKKAEDRLRQTQKLESIGLLAGGIAHDFNNLLTGVMGNASLLLEDAAPERAETLRSIIASTERAAHLTRQLLAYSGKGQFIVRELDVTQAVNEMADLVQFSIPKSADLRLDLQRRLPPVAMDPGQLQQILMNLVINAGEAIGDGNPGSITVTTSMADVDSRFTDQLGEEIAPGRYVCVEVRDNGSGIDPEKKAKIFDPFFTTKFVGRGLGLAAIAGILRSQKGGIIVESTPGKGSTFRVFLPAAGKAGLAVQEPGSHDGRPAILVVDDEVAVRDFISAALRRKGYQVVEASDGQEALAVVGSAPGAIDAAIVDIIMPNMSANDLLPALKAKQPGMRILLTSGYSEAEARRLCAAYPGAAFIQKPYTAQQLVRAVDELVGASGS